MRLLYKLRIIYNVAKVENVFLVCNVTKHSFIEINNPIPFLHIQQVSARDALCYSLFRTVVTQVKSMQSSPKCLTFTEGKYVVSYTYKLPTLIKS